MGNNVQFTINFGGNAVQNAKELVAVTGDIAGKLDVVRGAFDDVLLTSKISHVLLQFINTLT